MAMSPETIATAALFDTVTKVDATWSPHRQMVSNVFNAFPTRALTREQITLVAQAVEALPQDADLTPTLAYYVRKGVLRTRSSWGKKFYEVNF